jgi:hypothetical protein
MLNQRVESEIRDAVNVCLVAVVAVLGLLVYIVISRCEDNRLACERLAAKVSHMQYLMGPDKTTEVGAFLRQIKNQGIKFEQQNKGE